MTLGVIVGSAIHDANIAEDGQRIDHDGVGVLVTERFAVLPRHGLGTFVLPHRIDHRANLAALVAVGADRILSVSSVGSLRADWRPGTCVLADDFYAPAVTISFHTDARAHHVPGFDPVWRAEVAGAWRAHSSTPIIEGGVYAQTSGPRFETPAEVRALARVADLVGMTVAAECSLAGELGIPYAALCVVDNYANGISSTPLTLEEYRAGVAAHRALLLADLDAVVPALAGAR